MPFVKYSKVDQVRVINDGSNGFSLLLQVGETVLPIAISYAEALPIQAALAKIEPLQPLTCDLAWQILVRGETRLVEVGICELRPDNIFTGYIQLQYLGLKTFMILACRPSDAVALALRANCPIKIAETVLAQAGQLAQTTPVELVCANGDYGEQTSKKEGE